MYFVEFWINKDADFDISYDNNFLSFIDIISEEEEKVKDEDTND